MVEYLTFQCQLIQVQLVFLVRNINEYTQKDLRLQRFMRKRMLKGLSCCQNVVGTSNEQSGF